MKYNKFNVGDVVKHNENAFLKFIVIEVMESVLEKKGNHLYRCKIYKSKGRPKVYNYHEQDLKESNKDD